MADSIDLDAAVVAGLITAEQQEALISFSRSREQEALGADEEHFRFITGFNDIFVTIAIALVLVAVSTLGERIAPNARGAGPAVAITSWALAEYFTRVRRMALPSIVLLLAFVGGLFAFGLEHMREFPAGDEIDTMMRARFGVAASLAVAGACLHWWRFHVPITVAAGAAAAVSLFGVLVGLGLASAGASQAVAVHALVVTGAIGGIAVFALAMWFDMSDRARVTRRTDTAFWLHLLAAPLIVHPLFVSLGLFGGDLGTMQAVLVVAIYIVLTVIALLIDRRALLVSALAYVIYAIFALFRTAEAVDLQVALTCLVIGLFLVMLSAAWRPIRAKVIELVPADLAARLPMAA